MMEMTKKMRRIRATLRQAACLNVDRPNDQHHQRQVTEMAEACLAEMIGGRLSRKNLMPETVRALDQA